MADGQNLIKNGVEEGGKYFFLNYYKKNQYDTSIYPYTLKL